MKLLNPIRKNKSFYSVRRGSSYRITFDGLSPTIRYYDTRKYRNSDIGFRVAFLLKENFHHEN